jgi:hypothetical protein
MRRKNDAHTQDDVEGVAQRLRAGRTEASPLELDRIKTSAMARVKPTRGRVGTRRLAVAGLTAGLLLATTGGVLAGQGGGGASPGNAAIAQYGNNCDVGNNNGNGNGGNGGSGNNNESNNGNNNYNCNENSFNKEINNTTINNYAGSVVNNYTTVSGTPSGNVLDSKTTVPATSKRRIKIHVNIPRGAKLSRVTVKVDGKRVKLLKGKAASSHIELVDLPCSKGTTTIEVSITLTNGKTVTARHTYHLCTA